MSDLEFWFAHNPSTLLQLEIEGQCDTGLIQLDASALPVSVLEMDPSQDFLSSSFQECAHKLEESILE